MLGSHARKQRPPAASLLRRAARAEALRTAAWLLGAAVAAGGALIVGSTKGAGVAAGVGGAMTLWSLRALVGIRLGRADLERADTAPRRAYVALVSTTWYRPLLAVWPEAPPPDAPLPKPENVWWCDYELDALESSPKAIEVHEAWVDNGPRRNSKPRWVVADAGIAIPQRRAFSWAWQLTMMSGGRPDEPHWLTLPDPHTRPDSGQELALDESFLGQVVQSALIVAGVAVLGAWLL